MKKNDERINIQKKQKLEKKKNKKIDRIYRENKKILKRKLKKYNIKVTK